MSITEPDKVTKLVDVHAVCVIFDSEYLHAFAGIDIEALGGSVFSGSRDDIRLVGYELAAVDHWVLIKLIVPVDGVGWLIEVSDVPKLDAFSERSTSGDHSLPIL